MKTLIPGTVLPNGATVLEHQGDVVLADFQRGCQPYVTWNIVVIDGALSCYWGHYHTTVTEAARDFEHRVH